MGTGHGDGMWGQMLGRDDGDSSWGQGGDNSWGQGGDRPVTTGEMLKGRSSMLMTISFPGNSFLEIRIALVTPKTVLIGTATAANSNVIFT